MNIFRNTHNPGNSAAMQGGGFSGGFSASAPSFGTDFGQVRREWCFTSCGSEKCCKWCRRVWEFVVCGQCALVCGNKEFRSSVCCVLTVCRVCGCGCGTLCYREWTSLCASERCVSQSHTLPCDCRGVFSVCDVCVSPKTVRLCPSPVYLSPRRYIDALCVSASAHLPPHRRVPFWLNADLTICVCCAMPAL